MTSEGRHPLEEQFTALLTSLAALTREPASALTRDDREAALEFAYRFGHRVEAVKLHFVRLLADETSPAEVIDHLTTSPRNVSHNQASRDVEAAKLTDPSVSWDGAIGGQHGDRGALQMVGAKLATGELSRSHLDVFHSTWKSLATPVRRGHLTFAVETSTGELLPGSQPNAKVLDAFFATTAAQHAPGLVKQLTEDMLEMLDPLRSERGREPDSEARRSFTRRRHHGITRYTIDATDEDSPFIDQVVRAHSAPEPAHDGEPDARSQEQRHYDGLLELLHLGTGNTTGALAQRSTVVVHTTINEAVAARDAGERTGSPVADGVGPLDDDLFRFMTCNADLRTILFDTDGTALTLETTARAASQNQRDVLTARDRGCVAPGCGKPAWLTHAHHVTFWADGGPTSIDNMVLLCGLHHRQLHQGRLEVRFADDGRPLTRWTHPAAPGRPPGPWQRNTAHERLTEGRALARRLRSAFRDPGAPAPPAAGVPG